MNNDGVLDKDGSGMRTILGIDPGIAATGYGIIRCNETEFHCVAHGTIKTAPHEPTGDRLMKIADSVIKVVVEFSPHEAGVELLYFTKNSKSAIPVAQARGVVLYTLARCGIPAFDYTPLEVKQAVAGNGRAEKRQVQEALRYLFGLEKVPKPTHAADALAVAVCHMNTQAFRNIAHV